MGNNIPKELDVLFKRVKFRKRSEDIITKGIWSDGEYTGSQTWILKTACCKHLYIPNEELTVPHYKPILEGANVAKYRLEFVPLLYLDSTRNLVRLLFTNANDKEKITILSALNYELVYLVYQIKHTYPFNLWTKGSGEIVYVIDVTDNVLGCFAPLYYRLKSKLQDFDVTSHVDMSLFNAGGEND